jgi:hypothetical protein
MIVAMKFTAPSSDDVISNTIRSARTSVHQTAWESANVASGEYDVHPACAALPGNEETRKQVRPPSKYTW